MSLSSVTSTMKTEQNKKINGKIYHSFSSTDDEQLQFEAFSNELNQTFGSPIIPNHQNRDVSDEPHLSPCTSISSQNNNEEAYRLIQKIETLEKVRKPSKQLGV